MKDHTFHSSHWMAALPAHSVFARLRRHGILFIVFLLAGSASLFSAAPLKLAWDANPETDIAGYRIHYRTSSGNPMSQDVANVTTTSIPNLVPGVRYFITVSAINSAGLVSPASAEISTVYDPDSDSDGLPDSWEIAHGLVNDPTNGSLLGDPDRDGLTNLVEYALNLSPNQPQGSSPTANTIQVNPADGKHYLTLTYHRRIYAPGVSYTVEATTNFVSWNSSSNAVEQVGTPIADPDGITETVVVRIKPSLEDSSGPTSVARLRITR